MKNFIYYLPSGYELLDLPSPAEGLEQEEVIGVVGEAYYEALEAYNATVPRPLRKMVTFELEGDFRAWNGGYCYRQCNRYDRFIKNIPAKAREHIDRGVVAALNIFYNKIKNYRERWREELARLREEEEKEGA